MGKKPSQNTFLLDLLCWIDRGETRAVMAKLLNFSKQRLSYHIESLKAKGLIEEVQKRPYSLYRLTPLGSRVKDFVGQSGSDFDSKIFAVRCHNLILGFPIEVMGSFQFNPKLWKDMRSFKYQELLIKGHKIQIQDSNLMKIYCPEVYALNADEGFDKAVEEASRVAQYVASRYQMKLGQRYRIRNGQKEFIGTEKIGAFLGHIKMGGVWVDISDKENRRLEADQDNNQIEGLFNMPDRIERMEKAITEMLVPALKDVANQNKWLSENIESHKELLNKIGTAIQELRDAINKLGDKK